MNYRPYGWRGVDGPIYGWMRTSHPNGTPPGRVWSGWASSVGCLLPDDLWDAVSCTSSVILQSPLAIWCAFHSEDKALTGLTAGDDFLRSLE